MTATVINPGKWHDAQQEIVDVLVKHDINLLESIQLMAHLMVKAGVQSKSTPAMLKELPMLVHEYLTAFVAVEIVTQETSPPTEKPN